MRGGREQMAWGTWAFIGRNRELWRWKSSSAGHFPCILEVVDTMLFGNVSPYQKISQLLSVRSTFLSKTSIHLSLLSY